MIAPVVRLALAVTLAASVGPGASIAVAQGDGRYAFTRYGTEHGLPSDRTVSIAQDSLGFVWIGTTDGVARFDGVRSRVWRHRPGSASGLPSSVVGAAHVAADGTVWVGTSAGLARFDAERGRFVRFAERALHALNRPSVSGLNSDQGGLWVVTTAGAVRVRYDGTAAPIPGLDRPQLVAPRPGEVWALDRACRLRDHPARCEPVTDVLDGALAALWAQGAETWSVTHDGTVWRLAPTPAPIGTWPQFEGTPQNTSVVVGLPYVWAATPNGLLVYNVDQGRYDTIGPDDGVTSLDVRKLMIDRQGGVWVTTENGVYRWGRPDPAFHAVTAADGLPDGRVNGLYAAAGGSTYVGTNGGLYRRAPDGTWAGTFVGRNAYAHGVWQVAPSADGGLWVGGKGFGLRKLWPETGRWERTPDLSRQLAMGGEPGGRLPVRHVIDVDGRVWVASSNGLAVRERDGVWRFFVQGPEPVGLPATAANFVHVANDGRVWVATDGGMVEVVDGGLRRVATASLGSAVVWHVVESPDDPGALWLATIGTGACRLDLDAERARCYTTADGLPSNTIHRIEYGAGSLWLGSDRGVSRFDPRSGAVATFTRADGLHGDVADLLSSTRAPDGTLYFGGPGGYTAFDPTAVAARREASPPMFSSVTVGGVRQPVAAEGDTVRLARGARRFGAEFATLDFTAPDQNRYRYRLSPLETEWTTADARSAEARYAALPPGDYVLDVVGNGRAGTFGKQTARLYVTVPPAWWERRSVQALGLLLALATVGAAGWRAVRRSERQRADEAEVAQRLAAGREAERFRLARELHDGAMQHLYRTGHDLDRLVDAAGSEAVAPVRAGLDEAAGELRAVLTDIRPPHVGTLGAAAAVRAAANRFAGTYPDVCVDVAADTTGRRWPVPVQHAAVRIVQEALSNVGRHAGASIVQVTLAEADDHAVIEVADDGRGFDTRLRDVDHVRASHFGLAGLRERAEGLGGRVEITSVPDVGTRVQASLPLSGRPALRRPWPLHRS